MIGKLTNVEAEKIARTSVDLLRHNLSDCDVRSEILHGRASSELLREVARFEPEFLVMGSLGHSGVAKAIFGSAVDAILTHATCSVAIIKSTADKSEVVAHQPAVSSETSGPAIGAECTAASGGIGFKEMEFDCTTSSSAGKSVTST
jgi:hypothetical protein